MEPVNAIELLGVTKRFGEVIAKTMWMLGNFDLHSIDVEDIFYRSINYDVIFGKNRKC